MNMANHRGHAVAEQRRALFSSVDRVQLLAQAMGKPTGEIVTIGGLEFDLVPLSTLEAFDVIELIDRFGSMISQTRNGGSIDEVEVTQVVHAEGNRVLKMMKSILGNSVYFENDEQEKLFNDWFDALPIVESLRALIPAVMRANALKKLQGNEQPAEPIAATPAEPEVRPSSETSPA